jgi:uncharacterized protein
MTTIDRITPSLEPDQHAVMLQNWHHLLFLHWEIPPAELQALLPPALTLDTFEGKAYISLIPFTMTGVRPPYTPPLPGLSSFHEVNLRTYVHAGGKDPGVWFFSLDASSKFAVAAARATYKLPYFDADIDFEVSDEVLPLVRVDSRRNDVRGPMPANAHIQYRPAESPLSTAVPGTLDHFLCERYVLYSQDDQKQVYRARVHHHPYPLQRVDVTALDETLVWAAGFRRAEGVGLRHYCREVNVKVYAPEKV